MSSRATRHSSAHAFEPFDWNGRSPQPSRPKATAPSEPPPPSQAPATVHAPPVSAIERATIERDAFGQGFAQGERAGAEAAAARSEAVLQRLKQTIAELQSLRA